MKVIKVNDTVVTVIIGEEEVSLPVYDIVEKWSGERVETNQIWNHSSNNEFVGIHKDMKYYIVRCQYHVSKRAIYLESLLLREFFNTVSSKFAGMCFADAFRTTPNLEKNMFQKFFLSKEEHRVSSHVRVFRPAHIKFHIVLSH